MLKEMLNRIRQNNPLVHCITNFVTVNDCANLLLAAGASPTMADTPEEMAEIVALSSALSVNIGTISTASIAAMFEAARAAVRWNRPAVLDPVGAGASRLRTETARKLLETGAFSLLRGNISEIKAVAGVEFTSHGVDASMEDALTGGNQAEILDFVRTLADRYHITVAISGATDLLCNGQQVILIRNGDPMMPQVTGSGCMLTVLCGAYLGVEPDALKASAGAFCTMGVCGEIARTRLLSGEGNASYRTRIIDAMYNLDGDTLERMAKIESF